MRVSNWMALGLLLVCTSAFAGPKVPKNLRDEVPPEVISATEALQTEVTELEAKITEAKIAAERADGDIKVLKLKVDAAKAAVEAAQAKEKAAKKAKDKQGAKQAKDEVAAAEEEVRLAQARDDVGRARADLLKAQVKLLEAEMELKDSDVQFQMAQSLVDAHPEIDLPRFEAAKTKAEIAFSEAQTDYSLTEAKFNAKGGTEVDFEGSGEGAQ